jgi:hypothetical protein
MGSIRTLADLKQVKQTLADQHARLEAEAAEKKAALALQLANKNLFASSIGIVQPMLNVPKVLSKKSNQSPIPCSKSVTMRPCCVSL